MSTDIQQAVEVRAAVEVPASPERAYELFTAGFDRWWSREYHLLPGELRSVGLEPFAGGRLWEENDAGACCTWGHVLECEPPRRLVFSWQIGPDWAVPAPDAPASRVRVTFTPRAAAARDLHTRHLGGADSDECADLAGENSGGTRVEVVHDGFEAHGPGWEAVRDGVGGDGGWAALLRRFAEAL